MRRKISWTVFGLALLLLLAIGGWWVRSYFVTDWLEWSDGSTQHVVSVDLPGPPLTPEQMRLRGDYPETAVDVPTSHSVGSERGSLYWVRDTSDGFVWQGWVWHRLAAGEIYDDPREPSLHVLRPWFDQVFTTDRVVVRWATLMGKPGTLYDPRHKVQIELQHVVAVPFWVPFCLAAGLVVVAARPIVREWRHRRRVRLGLCRSCGYDLRAHGGGEKCPECGTAKT